MNQFNFSEGLRLLKAGTMIAREGWNGKGMFIFLTPGSNITIAAGRPLAVAFAVGTEVKYLPHIDMKTADGAIVPWLASQTDILADDWCIVYPPKFEG